MAPTFTLRSLPTCKRERWKFLAARSTKLPPLMDCETISKAETSAMKARSAGWLKGRRSPQPTFPSVALVSPSTKNGAAKLSLSRRWVQWRVPPGRSPRCLMNSARHCADWPEIEVQSNTLRLREQTPVSAQWGSGSGDGKVNRIGRTEGEVTGSLAMNLTLASGRWRRSPAR